ncbi:hypothetical protein GH733_012599 [Mirounga leonina]|nr:hypothetical protein GH733_012599 [Mirounga leonina]
MSMGRAATLTLGEEPVCGGKSESSPGPWPSSPPLLLPQTEQLAALQVQDAAGAQAGLMPTLPRLRRRDTHFPICLFCCGCCNKPMCGLCCRT